MTSESFVKNIEWKVSIGGVIVDIFAVLDGSGLGSLIFGSF